MILINNYSKIYQQIYISNLSFFCSTVQNTVLYAEKAIWICYSSIDHGLVCAVLNCETVVSELPKD